MNEGEINTETREKTPPALRTRSLVLIVGVAAALVVAGALLFTQTGDSVGCGDDWPCMLYFYADGWVMCEQMEPIVDGLVKKYGNDLNIVRVNVGDSAGKQLAREQGCIGQPAFVFFNSSGEQTRRIVGAQTVATFEQEIERLLGQPWQ